MQPNLRFVVCTRDSAPWIGQFLTAYRALGIEPLYIHDVRSVDATATVLQRAGAEVIDFDPAGDYVEAGMIKFGAMRAKSEWVFRIDDDEFPSLALVRWLANEGVCYRVSAVICSRRDVFRSGGNYAYTRHPNRYFNAEASHYLAPHHRLFRPSMVSFSERLHSPGFAVSPPFEFAPQDAFFIHCNCLVRSVSQRLAKLRRYEAISALSSWKFADEYVPEFFETSTDAAYDGLDEFKPLLATLQAPAEEEASLKPGELCTMQSEVAREQQAVGRRAADYKKRLARQIARYGEPVGPGLNRYRTTLAAGIDFKCPGLPDFLNEIKGLSTSEDWGAGLRSLNLCSYSTGRCPIAFGSIWPFSPLGQTSIETSR